MKSSFLTSSLLLCILSLILLTSGVAIAATSEADDASEMSELNSSENLAQHQNIRAEEGVASPFVNLQYKVMHFEGVWVVTIRGIIDSELILPATVEIGVPKATAVDWIGQVDAGLDDDPLAVPMSPIEIPPPYSIYTEGDTDIYTVVLSDSHAVQLEFLLTESPVVESTEDGAVQFSYTPLTDVDELWLATAIPADSAVVDPDIRELDGIGPHGERSFARTFYNAVGGQEYTALIEYRSGITEVEQNLNPLIPIGLAVAMLLIAGGGFWYFRKNEHKSK